MVDRNRRRIIAGSGLLLAGCAAPTADEAPSPRRTRTVRTWPMAGYDAGNTGYLPTGIALGRNVVDWRSEVDNRGDIVASPVIADGTAFAGSGQTIYAVSLADGSRRWATETPYGTGHLSGALADETVVFGGLSSDGGELLALDAEDGTVVWRHSIEVATAPTVVGDRVYVGTRDTERALAAIDGSSGDEVWSVSFPEGQAVRTTRAGLPVRGETIYARASDDRLTGPSTVLHAVGTDGEKRWAVDVSGNTNVAPAVDDAAVYFGTTDGTVYAIDAETPEIRWSMSVSGSVSSSPAIDADHVYLGTIDGHLYAIDKRDGTETWEERGDVLYTDPVVTPETIYIGGASVQARDKGDGTEKWTYGMAGKAHAEFTSPAVVDGTILFGACAKTRRNQIRYENYLVKLGSGEAATPG